MGRCIACCFIGLAFGSILAEQGTAQFPARGPQPNIILIMADDMGFSDLGCYGGEILTPILGPAREKMVPPAAVEGLILIRAAIAPSIPRVRAGKANPEVPCHYFQPAAASKRGAPPRKVNREILCHYL